MIYAKQKSYFETFFKTIVLVFLLMGLVHCSVDSNLKGGYDDNASILDAGNLEPSFGLDGTGYISEVIGASLNDDVRDMYIDSDGSIYVVGYTNNGVDTDHFIAKFTSAGSLDTGFGSGTGYVIYDHGTSNDRLNSITMDANSKLLVTGMVNDAGNAKTYIGRYSKTGELDTSFDSDGHLISNLASGLDEGKIVATDSAGNIYVGVDLFDSGVPEAGVAKYSSSGVLDVAFSGDGLAETAEGVQILTQGLGFDSNGDIFISGTRIGATKDLIIAKFTGAGVLDATWGAAGVMIYDFGGDDIGMSLAIDANSKVLVVGKTFDSGSGDNLAYLARFNTNGALDTTFNTTGYNKLSVNLALESNAKDIFIDSDGNILVAGNINFSSDSDFFLARYLNTGVLDATFGEAGLTTTNVSVGSDVVYSVAMDPDGLITLGGVSSGDGATTDLALAKYWP